MTKEKLPSYGQIYEWSDWVLGNIDATLEQKEQELKDSILLDQTEDKKLEIEALRSCSLLMLAFNDVLDSLYNGKPKPMSVSRYKLEPPKEDSEDTPAVARAYNKSGEAWAILEKELKERHKILTRLQVPGLKQEYLARYKGLTDVRELLDHVNGVRLSQVVTNLTRLQNAA